MKKPSVYPNEGFVVDSVADYFSSHGYRTVFAQNTFEPDLIAVNEKDRSDYWTIEAKGHTASITTDHNTALGQILKRMNDSNRKYAIAVPQTPQMVKECRKVPQWLKQSIGLHVIFVDEEGQVSIYAPNEQI
ncbi:hypothetical protein [Alicyclobacillus acidiphilus]|uniref:hypothetical protein n=1 Tax=Alicyclobacillus acidiphilus TaxID=182455 RepID=UPI000AAE8425|nr:hypothetical protein [Alicyclobacillus acidiphilus]